MQHPAAETALQRTPFLRAMVELFQEEARLLPSGIEVPVIIAGGAAVHYWTAANVTRDIDAEFGRRFIPAPLTVPYRDDAGNPRSVYLDTNYAPVFAILHEDYQKDAVYIGAVGGLQLWVLAPLDLAVSKLTRWQNHDRRDVRLLAEQGLIVAGELKRRAREAARGAIGNLPAFFASLNEALTLVRQCTEQRHEPRA
jgi:hypothetical protein